MLNYCTRFLIGSSCLKQLAERLTWRTFCAVFFEWVSGQKSKAKNSLKAESRIFSWVSTATWFFLTLALGVRTAVHSYFQGLCHLSHSRKHPLSAGRQDLETSTNCYKSYASVEKSILFTRGQGLARLICDNALEWKGLSEAASSLRVYQARFQPVSYGLGWAPSPHMLLGVFQKLGKLHYRFIL